MITRKTSLGLVGYRRQFILAESGRTHSEMPAETLGKRENIGVSQLFRDQADRTVRGPEQIAGPFHPVFSLKFLR